MSGRGYLRLISRLQGQGRQVELIYLALPDAEMSRLRVKERVKHGGHDVPTNVISRRFLRTLKNLLADYAGAASKTRCIMNSSYQPLHVFEQNGDHRVVYKTALYEHLVSRQRHENAIP